MIWYIHSEQGDLLRYSGRPAGTVQLTSSIVDRIFEVNISYRLPDSQRIELDYKTFLDLILAIENRKTFASIQYFFRLLDLNNEKRLTPFAITYFYIDIYKSLRASGYEAPNVLDVKGEIYDMVTPQDQDGIRIEEVMKSGQGEHLMAMLTDVNGFWRYDNREALMHTNSNDDEEDNINEEDNYNKNNNNNNGQQMSGSGSWMQ